MPTLRQKSLAVLNTLAEAYPSGQMTRRDIDYSVASGLIPAVPQWLTNNSDYRVRRGLYRLPVELLDQAAKAKVAAEVPVTIPVELDDAAKPAEPVMQNITAVDSTENYVPSTSKNYIPWGNSTDIATVLKSGRFLPIFVTGLSGNGKTFMIEQEVAKLGRELFRVNITTATDESDLIGGWRLVNGDTKWFDGAVVEAMKRGAVLLLDELDLGTEKIMCLQSVLEGKGIFVKKTNEWVIPSAGFTVIATGNTKGQGDDTDKFVGTNVMNEAFLERFPIWFDQAYPNASTEKKILTKLFKNMGIKNTDKNLITSMVKFATQTRKTFEAGACDDLITTRRLCLIAELMPVFGDAKRAVEVACNRFCEESRREFVELFDKIYVDETKEPEKDAAPSPTDSNNSDSQFTVNTAPF